jgi:CHAD domain-containing protein
MATQNSATKVKQEKPKLEDLLKNSLIDFDKNLIHQFRLEIKKLKAAMQLVHSANKSFDNKKKYGVISPLYKDLGAVRETQIEQEAFLNENSKNHKPAFKKKYQNHLDEELRQRQNVVLENFDKSILKSLKKIKRQNKNALKDMSSNNFKNYFKVRISKLRKTFDTIDFSDDKMHAMRKQIKEIKFNTRYKPKMAEKWLAKYKVSSTTLEDLQKLLGQWQDNVVLKERLAQQENTLFRQNGGSKALIQFKSNIESETALIKESIKKTLNF